MKASREYADFHDSLPYAHVGEMSLMGCGLNGSAQHLVLDTENGVYVWGTQEPSTIHAGKGAGRLEASGIAGLG